MKRLVVIPAMMVCACTITVSPMRKPVHEKRHVHRAVKHDQPVKFKPSPTPLQNQIHEQYQPIYEKLPPQPTVPPTP